MPAAAAVKRVHYLTVVWASSVKTGVQREVLDVNARNNFGVKN